MAKIRVVDLETTGFEAPEHAPVEIGWCDLEAPDDLLGQPSWAEARITRWWGCLLNPGRAIAPETSAIHHLTDADVGAADPWERVDTFSDAPLFAAHNARFERQWLTPERGYAGPWICTWKCALRAWPDAPGHGNQVLRYWLNPVGLDREAASPAHRAGPDAYVTAFLLRDLLRLHSIETLLAWSEEPAVLIRVPFGKRPEEGGNRGLRWTEVEDDFLEWTIIRDFSADILHTVRLEIARREALAKASADGGDP